MAKSTGARNMKANSIGSVTPVRNEVSAIENSRPPAAARRAGVAVRYMARQAPGRPNIITGKKPDMNAPARRIAGEESFEIAGDAVEVAEQEPGDVVDDVMQAGDDEHTIEHAIGEQAVLTGAEHRLAHRVHAVLQRLPAEAEHERHTQAREATDDGHETAAAEERQVARQADFAEAVVRPSCDQARQQAHRNTELGEFLGAERLRHERLELLGNVGGDLGRHVDEHLRALGGHQVAHHAGEARGAMILAREADRHAEGEQQAEVREDGVASGGDGGAG